MFLVGCDSENFGGQASKLVMKSLDNQKGISIDLIPEINDTSVKDIIIEDNEKVASDNLKEEVSKQEKEVTNDKLEVKDVIKEGDVPPTRNSLACGDTISESGEYNLSEDLYCNFSDYSMALRISADNVILDCDGNTINLNADEDSEPANSYIGIYVSQSDNVTLLNCNIHSNYHTDSVGRAISFYSSNNGVIFNLNLTYFEGEGPGIKLFYSDNISIMNSNINVFNNYGINILASKNFNLNNTNLNLINNINYIYAIYEDVNTHSSVLSNVNIVMSGHETGGVYSIDSLINSTILINKTSGHYTAFGTDDIRNIINSKIIVHGSHIHGMKIYSANKSYIENSSFYSSSRTDLNLGYFGNYDCTFDNIFKNILINSSSIDFDCSSSMGNNNFVWENEYGIASWMLNESFDSVVNDYPSGLDKGLYISDNEIIINESFVFSELPAKIIFINQTFINSSSISTELEVNVMRNNRLCMNSVCQLSQNGTQFIVNITTYGNYSLQIVEEVSDPYVLWIEEPLNQNVTFYENFEYNVNAEGSSNLTYSLIELIPGYFNINSSTGLITNTTSLEFGEIYNLTIVVENEELNILQKTISVSTVYTTKFNNNLSSNFSNVMIQNVINLTLGIPNVGLLIFPNSSFKLSDISLDLIAEMDYNLIALNTNLSPIFINKSATLELNSLELNNPKIKRNNEWCPIEICNIISYNNGTFIFNVTGFSNYSASDYCGNSHCESDESCSSCQSDCGSCSVNEGSEGNNNNGGSGGSSNNYDQESVDEEPLDSIQLENQDSEPDKIIENVTNDIIESPNEPKKEKLKLNGLSIIIIIVTMLIIIFFIFRKGKIKK